MTYHRNHQESWLRCDCTGCENRIFTLSLQGQGVARHVARQAGWAVKSVKPDETGQTVIDYCQECAGLDCVHEIAPKATIPRFR